MDINKIADKAYDNAKRLGKLASNRNAIDKIRDVKGEYIEAVKALSCGKHADITYFLELFNTTDNSFEFCFKEALKDTYEQELTDILFVVLTLMKDCDMDIEKHVSMGLEYNKVR